jgi:enoyl-CoA hydratase/carnithine racemase
MLVKLAEHSWLSYDPSMATPRLSRHDDVFLLDFGDDENVTSDAWVTTVHALLDEVERAEGPRALVTRGTGKHYSNGLDVPYMASVDADEVAAYVERVLTVVRRIMLLGVPTAAAVNGHAFGMGAFLILAHDHAVMREDRGYVCFPEVHLGMPFSEQLIEIVSSALEPRTMRRALTTGHRYSGPEAATAGIVDATGSLDELLDTASHTVGALAGTAGPNLARIKRQVLPAVAARVA